MTNLDFSNVLNSIKESAAANTAQSQAFAEKEMAFNAEQAALNREWQEKMANTAHQREVKDLLAAGLNPILSAGGAGAATPSGATASGSSGKVDESYSSALSSYLMSLINSATQISTAQMSANAMLGSAGMAAAASRYASDMNFQSTLHNNANAVYLAKNYPQTFAGILSSAGNRIASAANSVFGTSTKPNISNSVGASGRSHSRVSGTSTVQSNISKILKLFGF